MVACDVIVNINDVKRFHDVILDATVTSQYVNNTVQLDNYRAFIGLYDDWKHAELETQLPISIIFDIWLTPPRLRA